MKRFLLFVYCASTPLVPIYSFLGEQQARRLQSELRAIETAGGDRLGYAEAMSDYLARGKNPENSRWRERRQVSAFDLFSGSLAIRESLQVSSIRASDGDPSTGSEGRDPKRVAGQASQSINIATLKGPEVKSHPFAQMLKERKSVAFPMAARVPPDWFYGHFSSLTRALDFGDYLNQTGGAFYNRFSDAPIDSALKKRILQQLAIVENKEARIFYDTVLSEVGMVSSDFFFGMGTDVSLLFSLKQKAIFETTIKMYRGKFLKEVPGAKEETVKIEGASVHFVSSADNKLRSYLYIDDDFAIISNSPAALGRLIRVSQKKEPALAALDEFKYMRSIYTADRETEDGFIYFSDAFIRRLVSPQLRIAEARRMQTAFKLAQLEKFILLHQHAYGKTAPNLDQLIQNVALDESIAKKMRGSFAGFRVNGFRAEHPEMGTLGFLKPNLESGLKVVTKAEADGYQAFVTNYSNFWREYFDPIGIRLKKKSNGIKLEICILPLIENSIYNQVTQFIGGAPTTHTITSIPGETLSIAAKVNMLPLTAIRLTEADAGFYEGVTGNIQMVSTITRPSILIPVCCSPN